MISFQNICKTYKVAKREPGIKSALKSIVKRDYTYIEALKYRAAALGYSGKRVGMDGYMHSSRYLERYSYFHVFLHGNWAFVNIHPRDHNLHYLTRITYGFITIT